MDTVVMAILSLIGSLAVHRYGRRTWKDIQIKIAGVLIIIGYHAAWPIWDDWAFVDAFRYIVLGGGYRAAIWWATYDLVSARLTLGSSIFEWRIIRVFSTRTHRSLEEQYVQYLRDHGVEVKVLRGSFDDKVMIRKRDKWALEVAKAFQERDVLGSR